MPRRSLFIRCILLFFCFLAGTPLFAQFWDKSEVGLFLGGSAYQGELSPRKGLPNAHFGIGGVFRYNFHPRWTLKAVALFGDVSGADNARTRGRDLNFYSHINEYGMQCEFNFFDYITGHRKAWISPYIFAGFGVFSMEPKTMYINPVTLLSEEVSLRDMYTEGQGVVGDNDKQPYSLIQFSIPMGIGLKVSISRNICLGFEWGIRKTFTDYIDDVSTIYVDPNVLRDNRGQISVDLAYRSKNPQDATTIVPGSLRGNPNTYDWYSFVGFTVTTRLNFWRAPNCEYYKSSR